MIELEQRRLALQALCDGQKSLKDRNRLGQFATPPSLATALLRYALEVLPPDWPVSFLDPAFGTGAFYSALLRVFPHERIQRAQGFEIDPHYEAPTRALWRDHALTLTLGDFTATPSPNPTERFNLILCNPPYVRHHHLDRAQKARLQHESLRASGVKLNGLTGLYCHFLALSHAWLADDGLAGWLIPSEFMDVNYGAPLKRYLLDQVDLLHIQRFAPSARQFDDALVSSAVLWFRKRPPATSHKVHFSYGGTLATPLKCLLVPSESLRSEHKWTRFPTSQTRISCTDPKLSDFFKIQRGLVTGNNNFFIMTIEQIVKHDLPYEYFVPILPGPRHLPNDEIEAYPDGSPQLDHRLFLLKCRLPEKEIEQKHPSLWSYLQTGKPSTSERYLCRSRSPWYAQENRPPPPFLCTYMGRSDGKRDRPFRFILNHSQATAANVYLLLYPNPPLAQALQHRPALTKTVWHLLNTIETSTLLGEGRVYGGGLHKLEPKELAHVSAAPIEALLS